MAKTSSHIDEADLPALVEAIYRSAEIGLCVTDSDGCFVQVNEAYLTIYGYAEDELLGRDFADLVIPPEGRAAARALHRAFVEGRTDESGGTWNTVRRDGTPMRIHATATRLVGADGSVYTVTTVADLTERERERAALAAESCRRRRTDREARLSAERLRLAREAAGVASFDYEIATGEIAFDDAFRALHDLPDGGEAIDYADWERRILPEDVPEVRARLARALERGNELRLRYRVRRGGGEVRVIQAAAAVTDRNAAGPARLTGIALDVTEEERAREALEALAYRDAVTGLPNRSAAFRRLEALASKPAGRRGARIVLKVGLRRLKDLNVRSGAVVGDAVLVEVGRRLAATPGAFVARMGGDRFALMAPVSGRAEGERLAAAIAETVNRPFEVYGLSLPVRVDCGYVVLKPDADRAAVLSAFDAALLALNAARSGPRGRPVRYLSAMGVMAARQRLLSDRLPGAIERGEIHVAFQPQVEIATGRIVGLEALARWDLPDFGIVAPDIFIPIAERDGTILELGDRVAADVAAAVRGWGEAAGEDLRVAFNVSPVQIHDERFPAFVERLGALFAPLPVPVDLEITESAHLSPTGEHRARLEALRRHGIGIAIDDFGTGYSSLSYLEEFPVDVIKIDRSFVARLGESAFARKIVASVVEMAATLGARVVAEGIETDAQAKAVMACGCRFGQGFFFERAVSAERVAGMLAAGRLVAAGG